MATRKKRYITHKGETLSITDWAKKTGLDRQTIIARMISHPDRGAEYFLNSEPQYIRTQAYIKYKGERLSVQAWAQRLGFSEAGMIARIKRLPLTKALVPKNVGKRYKVEITSAEGVTRTLQEWAGTLGILPQAMLVRYRAELPIAELLRPISEGRVGTTTVMYLGTRKPLIEFSLDLGISITTTRRLLLEGNTPEAIANKFTHKTQGQ